MEVKYNVTGARRKELVKAISEITGTDAVYRNVPTFAYEVGLFTVTRDGTLEYPDDSDAETVKQVLMGLDAVGFESESTAEKPTEENATAETKPIGLTVSIPPDKVNMDNLTRLLDAKGDLIRKALGVSSLPVVVGEDAVSFPWFDELPDANSANAYTHFISALCQMSREQKRINTTSKDVENEKYAFRCFLLRLGFIGEEYKTERKILLRNLSGSSAFRDGGRHAVSQ